MKEAARKIFKTRKDPMITKVISPLQNFIQQEATGSKILLACIVIGLIWANIPWGDSYNFLWNLKLGFNFENFTLNKPIILWINDGLMAIFFFVLGLELKREFLIGGLSNIRQSLTSVIAASGGIIFPAIFFVAINPPGFKGANGWSIPVATDIAIAIGILSFFSYKIPKRMKLFLTSMAIFDDLISIVIIAIFYSANLNWTFFGISIGIIAILVIFNLLGFRNMFFYFIPGIFLWFTIFFSGIHATIAGVILAATIPATKQINLDDFFSLSKRSLDNICELEEDQDEISSYNKVITQVRALEISCKKIQAPLQILEHRLIGLTAFFIVPLFALANSGINFFALETNPFTERAFWGVFCGLLLGKPIGVILATFILTRFKGFKMPSNVNWLHIIGIGFLMGIGFTMSSFIAGLAYSGDSSLLSTAKIAILLGSLLAGIIGFAILHYSIKKFKADTEKSKSEIDQSEIVAS